MLYVYGFVDAPAQLPDVEGIDGSPLEGFSAGAVAAVASRHERTELEATEAAILAHARVVEALAAATEAVLPARFGGAYESAEALEAGLTERGDELRAALDRVRGCVELGLRAVSSSAEPVTRGTGAAYMQARLSQRLQRERRADLLHEPLAGLAREATRSVGATERMLLTGAYLVAKADVEPFRRAVERLQSEHADLGIVCTGPWPPYSFVTAEAGK